jgi:hypothetical protein
MNDLLRFFPWRMSLRQFGRSLVLLGLGFALLGMIEFLSTFGLARPLRLIWCVGVGMPMLLVGIILTSQATRIATTRRRSGDRLP